MKKPKPLAPDREEVLRRIAEYEREGGEAFFRDVENDPPSRTLTPRDVDYLHVTAKYRINGFFARIVEGTAAPFITGRHRLKIEGTENLANLRSGAVFTSNHFERFENLAVRRVSRLVPGRHRFYKLIREGNYFIPGFIGWLLRYADTLPLSSSVKTTALLGDAVSKILKRGDHLLVYPEQAMWWNYEKPRPLRIGAFHFAAKNGVPVVPCFVTLSPADPRLPVLPDNVAWTVHVGSPLYPDPTLSVRENAEIMREKTALFNEKTYRDSLAGNDS